MTLEHDDIVSDKEELPRDRCGIYFLIDGDEIVYVGQSTQILFRILTHIKEGKKKFDGWAHIECSPAELTDMETEYIIALQPKYNKVLPNDADYITIGEIKRRFGVTPARTKGCMRRHGVVAKFGGRYWRRESAIHALRKSFPELVESGVTA